MKKLLTLLLVLIMVALQSGCGQPAESIDIVTTTAPLFTFTTMLCYNTDLTVDCLITENVSCLHDYTLQTSQMRAIEAADLIIISGAGLEDTFADILYSHNNIVDTSAGIELLWGESDHEHDAHESEHHHEQDPHIWLSPQNATVMVSHISSALMERYPEWKDIFMQNQAEVISKLNALNAYAEEQLANLTCNKIITFHDGFGYMAAAFDLHILHAIEEEAGREASAAELIHLCELVEQHKLPCLFVEKNGSVSAADIVSAEMNIKTYSLDMAMSGNYFEAMYHNIDTLKEALR